MNDKKFLYQKVYEDIRDKIKKGIYKIGDGLPWDEQLCEQYQTSKITISKALKMLAEDGYIKRVPGKGTFVCDKEENKKADLGKEKLLGVVLEHVSTPFGLELMYHLDRLAAKYGYRLMIRFSYGDREKETEEIKFLLSLHVQGLLLMPCHGKYYSPEILRLCLQKFPMVLIDKKLNGIPLPSVRTDNKEAIAMLVREMKLAGYERLAFISTDDTEANSVKERKEGFLQETQNQGIEQTEFLTLPIGCWEEEFFNKQSNTRVMKTIQTFFKDKKDKIDGVIAGEYSLVPAIVQAMHTEGITAGGNMGISCIDEDYQAALGTTFMHVKQDEKKIAEKALELLFTQIEGEIIEWDDFLIPGMFVKGTDRHF